VPTGPGVMTTRIGAFWLDVADAAAQASQMLAGIFGQENDLRFAGKRRRRRWIGEATGTDVAADQCRRGSFRGTDLAWTFPPCGSYPRGSRRRASRNPRDTRNDSTQIAGAVDSICIGNPPRGQLPLSAACSSVSGLCFTL